MHGGTSSCAYNASAVQRGGDCGCEATDLLHNSTAAAHTQIDSTHCACAAAAIPSLVAGAGSPLTAHRSPPHRTVTPARCISRSTASRQPLSPPRTIVLRVHRRPRSTRVSFLPLLAVSGPHPLRLSALLELSNYPAKSRCDALAGLDADAARRLLMRTSPTSASVSCSVRCILAGVRRIE